MHRVGAWFEAGFCTVVVCVCVFVFLSLVKCSMQNSGLILLCRPSKQCVLLVGRTRRCRLRYNVIPEGSF